MIATFAHFKAGGGYGSYPLMIGAILCFSVFLLSFKYGTKNINRFDIFCLASALSVIFLYIFVENSLYSIILIVLIDIIAFSPTFRKGYQEPESETVSLYFMATLSNILGILATQNYNYTTVLYPASLTLTNFLFFAMILIMRRNLKTSSSMI